MGGGKNESTGGERKNEKLTTHERKLANTIGEELNAEAQSSPNESRSTHHAAASCSSRSFPLQLLPNSRLCRSSQTVKRKKETFYSHHQTHSSPVMMKKKNKCACSLAFSV